MNKIVEEIKGAVEYISLFGQKMLFLGKRIPEEAKTIVRYWGNSGFRKVDSIWLATSMFKNPYRMGHEFQGSAEAGDYTYGETPLVTMEHIAKECGIKKKDLVYELGSGRGRVAFWLGTHVGCRVVGIENVPGLYEISQAVVEKSGIKNVSFKKGDYLEEELSPASVVYLFGTTLGDHEVERLIASIKKCRAGTKLITVSYPLEDPQIKLLKVFEAKFHFGKANVFYHKLA